MNILFVCVQNAGRSQMAEALFRRLSGDGHEAMRELGVDLADRVPRRLERTDAEWADVVVTMGCGDACPYIPGKRYLDWELDDPAGKSIAETRAVRDEIASRVELLIGELEQEDADGDR